MSQNPPVRILFVEDNATLREATMQGLELEGMKVDAFDSADEALAQLDGDFPGVIVTDIRLPGMDGLEFFDRVSQLDPELPVILTTGHGDVAMAVNAMRKGAVDFLTKPYSTEQLFLAIKRAATNRQLVLENRKLRNALGQRSQAFVLGSSDQAMRINRMISDVTAADIDLMISGESGTGKNYIARKIHELGPRQSRPFVVIDAGIVAHKDAELLIFGREPGARLSRSGLIERANGGTVLLDEITAIPERIQARLLSLVESRKFLPIDSDRPRAVDIRVISTSHLAGGAQIEDEGGISTRLLHRLSGIAINLPPLRERREDLPELFRHFVQEYERDLGQVAAPISEVEWSHLTSHDWPGNLRELRDFARNFVLGLARPLQQSTQDQPAASFREMAARFERAVLEDALRIHGGSAAAVARALSIQRKTLYDKLAKHGLKPADFRG